MDLFRRVFLLLLGVALFQGCTGKKAWDLVWTEEFEYSGSPAEESWGYEIGHIRNNELQYYSDKLQNVKVEDGVCVITARLRGD